MFISIWTSSADVSSSLKVSCHKLRTVSFWYGTIRHLRQLDFFNVQTLRRRSSRAKKCIHLLEFLKSGHIVIALALLVISSTLFMFGAACLDAILLASDCFLQILPGRHKLCIL